MNLGENIKLFRKKSGLTQKQLAQRIGVSTISIQNYENNRRTPDISTLEKISEALNYSLIDLLSKDVNSYDELIKEMLDYIINKYEVGQIQLKYPDMNEYVITLSEAFLDFFGFFLPEKNEFNENITSDMLVTFIYKDFDFSTNILKVYADLINNFNETNRFKINNALNEYNVSLDFFNTISTEISNPQTFINNNGNKYIDYSANELKNISYIEARRKFQSILDYIKLNSKYETLKLIGHDPDDEKLLFEKITNYLEQDLLMILINRGELVSKNELIKGDDNNGNQEE